MDIILEEVVKLIGNVVNRAINCLRNTVAKGEGEGGPLAGWEWNVLKFTKTVGNLESLTSALDRKSIGILNERGEALHVRRSH